MDRTRSRRGATALLGGAVYFLAVAALGQNVTVTGVEVRPPGIDPNLSDLTLLVRGHAEGCDSVKIYGLSFPSADIVPAKGGWWEARFPATGRECEQARPLYVTCGAAEGKGGSFPTAPLDVDCCPGPPAVTVLRPDGSELDLSDPKACVDPGSQYQLVVGDPEAPPDGRIEWYHVFRGSGPRVPDTGAGIGQSVSVSLPEGSPNASYGVRIEPSDCRPVSTGVTLRACTPGGGVAPDPAPPTP